MSQPESKDQGMKRMMVALLACCAIPLGVFLFLGGSLVFLFGRSVQPPATNQAINPSASTPQPGDLGFKLSVRKSCRNALSEWVVLRVSPPRHIVSHFRLILHHVFATTTSHFGRLRWRLVRLRRGLARLLLS